MTTKCRAAGAVATFAAWAAVVAPPAASAQDRLKAMPGYEQAQRMSKEIPGAVKSGALSATWSDDGRTLTCAPSSDWPANTKFTWKLNPAGSVLPLSSEGGIPLATA